MSVVALQGASTVAVQWGAGSRAWHGGFALIKATGLWWMLFIRHTRLGFRERTWGHQGRDVESEERRRRRANKIRQCRARWVILCNSMETHPLSHTSLHRVSVQFPKWPLGGDSCPVSRISLCSVPGTQHESLTCSFFFFFLGINLK